MGEEELIGGGWGEDIQNFGYDIGEKLWNKSQTDRQMNFQKMMSDTAYTRQVRDLKMAGLNPMLAVAKGGGGASTPSGAASQSHAGSAQTKESLAQLALTSAMTREHHSGAELKDTERDDMLMSRDSRLALEILKLSEMKGKMAKDNYEMGKLEKEIENLEEQRRLLRLEQSHSALDLDRAKSESKFYKGPGGQAKPYTQLLPFYNALPGRR